MTDKKFTQGFFLVAAVLFLFRERSETVQTERSGGFKAQNPVRVLCRGLGGEHPRRAAYGYPYALLATK